MSDLEAITAEWRAMAMPDGFQLIMADPPWSFRNYSAKGHRKSAHAHYLCRDAGWINGLPVRDLADPAGCLLWLWATNPMLDQCLDTLKAWGFSFVTAGAWVKRTRHGKLAFGTGYVLRSAHEPFLIGRVGRISTSRSVRSVVEGMAREHSRKPEEAFAAAETLIPGARRIELFARQSREGWASWGDEKGKFDGPRKGQAAAAAADGSGHGTSLAVDLGCAGNGQDA